jgi:hypothetical protein
LQDHIGHSIGNRAIEVGEERRQIRFPGSGFSRAEARRAYLAHVPIAGGCLAALAAGLVHCSDLENMTRRYRGTETLPASNIMYAIRIITTNALPISNILFLSMATSSHKKDIPQLSAGLTAGQHPLLFAHAVRVRQQHATSERQPHCRRM